MPMVDAVIEKAANGVIFSRFDIKSAFFHLPLAEESKPGTACSTPTGHVEYERVPMGLTTAPAAWVRGINMALDGLEGACTFFDDVLCVSQRRDSPKATTIP
jgi:hypothetical protein